MKISDTMPSTHLSIHFVIDDEVFASVPVASLHGLGGRNHVLSHALWGSGQSLPLTHLHHVVKVLTDHAATHIQLVG